MATNKLETGAAWLAGKRDAHMASTVSYRRGADSVSLAATKGATPFTEETSSGQISEVIAVDWIILRDALVLDGTVELPEAGDLITETIAGQGDFVYEVSSPGSDQPWEYVKSNPLQTELRIHTKRIEVAPD